MKPRSVAAPLLLPLITFGIYGLVWQVKTKTEMNQAGQKVPTAWWLIVPFANIWWLWAYSVAAENFTNKGISKAAAFWLQLLLGVIGYAVVQSAFNNKLARG
jgi:Domain of unknown function (DUF4234)